MNSSKTSNKNKPITPEIVDDSEFTEVGNSEDENQNNEDSVALSRLLKGEILQDEALEQDPSADDDIIEVGQTQNSSENLPAVGSSREVTPLGKRDPLTLYLQEISQYKLLTPEEEKELTQEFSKTGDIKIAKDLVQANLRLVVKIALEYRHAYQNVLDLIQEGNVGLMKAVSLYDPSKGAKLSYYASWWIKSYILKFLLDNFRLVKIGTTADQKKLFYNLMKEKERLEAQGIKPDHKMIADNLGVSEKSVALMEQRLSPGGGEVSLDKPSGHEDGQGTFGDTLSADSENIDDILGDAQEIKILQENLVDFLSDLKERDKNIFQQRLLNEVPLSLQAIADQYGVSRERIRQIETRLLNKLKEFMSDKF